jgi:hypothetical protein
MQVHNSDLFIHRKSHIFIFAGKCHRYLTNIFDRFKYKGNNLNFTNKYDGVFWPNACGAALTKLFQYYCYEFKICI